MKFWVSIAVLLMAASVWARDCRPHVRHHPCSPVIIHHCNPHYAGGYYTYRTETVMIAPQRIERRYVPPVYETRFTPDGRPYTVKTREGYFHNIVIPAQYSTRQVRVWVPRYHSHHHHHRSGVRFNFSFGQKNLGLNFGIYK